MRLRQGGGDKSWRLKPVAINGNFQKTKLSVSPAIYTICVLLVLFNENFWTKNIIS